jgi:hypothetical protein
MATYAEPYRWNKTAREASERAEKLRKDVEENSSDSSKILRSLNSLAGKKAAKAEEDALQHRLNIKESMAEDEDQNVADQYPKGTTYGGLKSRNKAEYGKKVDLPMEGKAKGGTVKKYASGGSVSARADGCVQRGKTRGKMV